MRKMKKMAALCMAGMMALSLAGSSYILRMELGSDL